VGNAGNGADDTGYGAVSYAYNIGKYEVTAGQYTEFLNAVADTDTYGLYNTEMWSATYGYGCKIQRSGSVGSYTYSVANNSTDGYWANRPVNYVSYGDSMRFANWLHNGQPTGAQGLSTTEDGAYYLDGAMTDEQLQAVSRKTAVAKWAVTSEDEWYKAAYHKNNSVTGGAANYYDYPTSSDSVPSNDLTTPDGGNNANCYQNGYTIGSPYYRTQVGEFENSDSPYGTFDQGGNQWEWNEAVRGSSRGLRGGSNDCYDIYMRASYRDDSFPSHDAFSFRVSEVPEPASIGVMALGSLGMLLRRRRHC
jgi:formylglycine-generating enzyme required for sulfatase activity